MMLCLLVALTPLVFAARLFDPYIAAKEILIQFVTATLLLLWLVSNRGRSLVLTPVWIPLLVIALIGLTSLLWSASPSASFGEAQRLATYILLFAITLSAMRTAESRAALAVALVLAGGIEAVYVLLQFALGDPIFATSGLQGKWRSFGTLGNPNWTGEFLAVAALVALGRIGDLRGRTSAKNFARLSNRHWTWIALILILLALAATVARGAWFAFIIGAVAFVFTRHRSGQAKVKLRSILPPLVFASMASAALVVFSLLTNREVFEHLFNLKSIRGRIWLSKVSWAMIRDAIWGGHGLGTFGLEFPRYQAQAFSESTSFISHASFTSYAHNDYLQLWAELGLFALVAFGALIWMVLRRGRVLASDPVALGCWAAVISLLVNATVGFPLHLPTTLMLFAVLAGVVEAAASKKTLTLRSWASAARMAIVLATLILCFSGYRFGYQLLRTETALWCADSALAGKNWNEAEAAINTAIQHAPARFHGHALRGKLHFVRGEYAQAVPAFERAQTLSYDPEIFDLKATAQEASGNPEAAITTLNELVWLRPDLSWPRERLAALHKPADDHEENRR